MNLQELFNLGARYGKASPVFVQEPKRPGFVETASQYAAPSTVFIKPKPEPNFLQIAGQATQTASPIFVKPKSQTAPNFIEMAGREAGPSPLFNWSGKAPAAQSPAGRQAAQAAPPAPVLPPYAGATPAGTRGIVQGITPGGQVDRSQSDLYKQYALNPQGQFDRYFGSSEMDRYFGSASRGKGAPKDLEAMQALAGQTKAPTDTPLATYYRAQSAAGRGGMDQIISAMGYQGPMAEWAKANPMLAQREYAKKFPGGAATQFLGKEGQPAVTDYPSTGFDTSALAGSDPINKPFELPGGAMTQGQAVSAPYFQANALAALKTNPQNASSQMPIGDRAEDFLQNLGILKTKPGQGAFGS